LTECGSIDLEGRVVNSRLAMYCPECKAEYRQGFTHCTDCDVDLVEELSSGPKSRVGLTHNQTPAEGTPDWGEMRTVWEGDNETECADSCRELLKEGIRYGVKQSIKYSQQGMRVDWKYQIQVPAADYERARRALGYEEEGDTELLEDADPDPEIELPARDDLPVEDVHGDWNARGWYPEDATLEVWSGNPIERGSVVEMSLKENRINYRVAMESDELKRVFVMPEDEVRAREIVREIVEGDPPND
jgi:hypothetical protein